MNVSERTLKAIAKAIRRSIERDTISEKAREDRDFDLAESALQALVDNASLKDWDALGLQVTIGAQSMYPKP